MPFKDVQAQGLYKNYHGHSLHPAPPLIFDCLESALLLDPD